MALNIGASGIIRPYVKYNAKSDKWFIRAEGGGDLDTFVIRLGDGHDRIQLFDALGDDRVQLEGFGEAFDTEAEVLAAAMQVGRDVVIDFGGGQTLTFERLTVADLSVDDFFFGF